MWNGDAVMTIAVAVGAPDIDLDVHRGREIDLQVNDDIKKIE